MYLKWLVNELGERVSAEEAQNALDGVSDDLLVEIAGGRSCQCWG